MRKILIVGGGTAGWMTAALFSKLFQGLYDVELIESEAIGTVGVGEATIPAIKKYNELVQLDEAEFMRRSQATFKLGIQFVDWLRPGHSHIHGFGVIGQDWEWLRCHHYWLRAHQRGRARDFSAYSINTAAAQANSWIQVFLGQGVVPRSYDPLVEIKSDPQIEQFLGNIAATIERCVEVMPSHGAYVRKFCPAETVA